MSSPVAFDASSTSGAWNNAETSVTWSHTCSGTNRVIIVYVRSQSAQSMAYSATYNGVSMTSIASQDAGGYFQAFYLINPASGANNVVVTRTAGTSSFMRVAAHSFNNANQAAQPDVFHVTTGQTSPVTVSVTTTREAWLTACTNFNNGDVTAGTGTTLQTVQGSEMATLISSSVDRTIGVNSLNWTTSEANTVSILIAVRSVNQYGTAADTQGESDAITQQRIASRTVVDTQSSSDSTIERTAKFKNMTAKSSTSVSNRQKSA